MKFNCCIQKQKESATPTKHNTNFQKTIEIKQKNVPKCRSDGSDWAG